MSIRGFQPRLLVARNIGKYKIQRRGELRCDMYEIRSVRQDDPGLKLRWFTSENCNADLYVWEDKAERNIVRFQFYFNRNQNEKVIEWKGADKLWFAGIDNGDFEKFYKAAPVFVRIDDVDLDAAFAIFQSYANTLDENVREFVKQQFRVATKSQSF